MDAEHERAERALAPSVPARVAGDDELLALLGLELQPVAAPPTRVAGVGALGEDSLEPLRLRRIEQRNAVVEGRRETNRRVRVEQRLEPRAALRERQSDERLALELEHVEEVVDERARALLHRREARPTLLVERADLAVQHAVRRPQCSRQRPRDGLEPTREIVAVSARQRRLAATDARERTKPVPLHLEQPAFARRRILGKRGEHRRVVPAHRGWLDATRLSHHEPVLRVAAELRRHERPESLEPLAVQVHRQPAVALLLDELVGAAIPDLDLARAVLARRDLALERAVVERMILDVHREHALAGLERQPLRHSPAREHAVPFEAEVVVEAPRGMALNDKSQLRALFPASERLRRRLRVALAPVLAQLRGYRPGQMRWISGLQRLFRPGENPVDSVEFPAKPLCEHAERAELLSTPSTQFVRRKTVELVE